MNDREIADMKTRIAELEPLQEVVAQLEDENRALEAENERLREALKAWDDAAEHTHDCSGRFHYSTPEKCDCWIKEPCRLTAEAALK